jgi:hypothetical protein
VFALTLLHAAGQYLTRGLQRVQGVPAVGVGVYPNRADFHGRVQGGGRVVYPHRGRHVSERERALEQNERLSAALVPALDLLPCPFAGFGLEAGAQGGFVGVQLRDGLRGLRLDAGRSCCCSAGVAVSVCTVSVSRMVSTVRVSFRRGSGSWSVSAFAGG